MIWCVLFEFALIPSDRIWHSKAFQQRLLLPKQFLILIDRMFRTNGSKLIYPLFYSLLSYRSLLLVLGSIQHSLRTRLSDLRSRKLKQPSTSVHLAFNNLSCFRIVIQQFFDQINVRQHHSAAAISLQTQFVQSISVLEIAETNRQGKLNDKNWWGIHRQNWESMLGLR